MGVGPRPRPAHERVLARVRHADGCWVFTGSTLKAGHGRVMTGSNHDGTRRPQLAHRVVYEALIGPIPEGFDLHHRCRQPACVNPEHLELLSHVDHQREHHFYGETCGACGASDWYQRKDGLGRQCRECRRRRRELKYQEDLGHFAEVSPWNSNVSGSCYGLNPQSQADQAECATRLGPGAWG